MTTKCALSADVMHLPTYISLINTLLQVIIKVKRIWRGQYHYTELNRLCNLLSKQLAYSEDSNPEGKWHLNFASYFVFGLTNPVVNVFLRNYSCYKTGIISPHIHHRLTQKGNKLHMCEW